MNLFARQNCVPLRLAALLVLPLILLHCGSTAGNVGGEPSAAPVAADTVLLLVVDTLRADRLGCYGYERIPTPNMDALAAGGVRFARAQAAASWTLPSMGALFTSRYPRQLALIENPAPPGKRFGPRQWRRDPFDKRLPDHLPTLGELMKQAGYLTAAFVNQPALNITDSFLRGFDDYHYPAKGRGIVRFEAKGEHLPQVWNSLPHAHRLDTMLITRFGEWLEGASGKPVFAWIHLLTPHKPYNQALSRPAGAKGQKEVSASDLYDAEVAAVDQLVGRIMKLLAETREESRTLIVFTSDHGEEFEEHGSFEHGHSLHQEVVRVPLVISAPGQLPGGRTVESHVRLLDLLPTLLELTGHPALIPSGLEGRSLARALRSGTAAAAPVFCEGMLYGGTKRSLTEGDYKIILDEQEDRTLLFDVRADPAERVDLAARESSRVRQLRARMKSIRERIQRQYDQDRESHPRTCDPEELDRSRERALQSLEALGYLEE